MKRVVKTAAAVAVFGLAAAAVAVPAAQAEVRHSAVRAAPGDGSPLDLLGGAGGGVLGGLFGGKKRTPAPASAPIRNVEQGPNVEGAWEFSPVHGMAATRGGRDNVVPGPARMARPPQRSAGAGGSALPLADLLQGSVVGSLTQLTTMGAVPGGTSGAPLPVALPLRGKARNSSLPGEAEVARLAAAARQALPRSSSGRPAPLAGPPAPLARTIPGTTRPASIDEIAPLVDDAARAVSANGRRATGTYGEVVTSARGSAYGLTGALSGR